jgi:hypothetical protein
MATTLDVLVMESSPGAADEAAAELGRAGHRLHRCYEVGERGFPCKGVRDPASCPIEQGLDVAVLVRPHISPRPSPLESGVRCALRAGVPLVENGREALDPFAPWIAARVGDHAADGIVDACTEAAETVFGALLTRIQRRTLRTMAEAAGQPGPLGCALERHGRGLRVELSGPPVGKDVEHALAVRVMDAVRAEGRAFATVDVTYRATS